MVLNRRHNRRSTPSWITVSFNYALMSSHPSWPTLFWSLTWYWIREVSQRQWIKGTPGIVARQRSGPLRSCRAFSQGMAFLAMLRMRWRYLPCTSLQMCRVISWDQCVRLSIFDHQYSSIPTTLSIFASLLSTWR